MMPKVLLIKLIKRKLMMKDNVINYYTKVPLINE